MKYREALKKSSLQSSNKPLLTDQTLKNLQDILASRPLSPLTDPVRNPAAVLLLLYPQNGQYVVHFHKRSQLVERHKGEVCFPGGVFYSQDLDPLATALRETHEESGILPQDVTILGQMDDVPTRTGYALKVFVGTIPYPYSFTASPTEVEEILEVPLSALQNTANWREEVRWQNGKTIKSHSFAHDTHLIYGATAKIVEQFLDIMSKVQQNGRSRLGAKSVSH
jgi:8-oxo-dGTP pyrophosphatase MutT (NUDIX family)